MSCDTTHIHYLSEKQAAKKGAIVINSAEDLINDLGGRLDIGKLKQN